MIDINIHETGDGGDLSLKGNDLSKTSSLFNMVYLALFGGNVEASTLGNELVTEQRFDWWANQVLFDEQPNIQFNSLTERTLRETTVNSSGRIDIENAVQADLEFMSDFAETSVSVTLETIDRIAILVTLQEPNNLQEQEFKFIWDATKEEVIETIQI